MTTASPRTVGWPSAPTAISAAVEERWPELWAATRFPSNLHELVTGGTSVVRVLRNGGPRDRDTDRARVLVDVVAPDEPTAEDLAEEIAVWLVDTRPIRGAGLILDGAETEVAPHRVPYPDPAVTQFAAVYVVSSRRLDAI